MFPFGFFAAALLFGVGISGAVTAVNNEEERLKYNRMLKEQQLLAERDAQQEALAKRNAASRNLMQGSTLYDEIEMDLSSTLKRIDLQTRLNKKSSTFFSDFGSTMSRGLNMYSQFQGSLKGNFLTKGPLNDKKRSNN